MSERDYRASCICLGLPFRVLPDPKRSIEVREREMLVFRYAKALIPIQFWRGDLIRPAGDLTSTAFRGSEELVNPEGELAAEAFLGIERATAPSAELALDFFRAVEIATHTSAEFTSGLFRGVGELTHPKGELVLDSIRGLLVHHRYHGEIVRIDFSEDN
jgi:hypothetical protein